MTSRFILISPRVRQNAVNAILEAPEGYVVTISEPKRSLEQNARLWAALGEIADQVEWYGQKLKAEDWKDMLTASLRKSRVVPGIDPGSFVVTGLHTSKMTVAEMSALLELAYAFGAERGVVFHDRVEFMEGR